MSSSRKTKQKSAPADRRGKRGSSAGTSGKRTSAPSDFHVKFWGVRGSIPSPGETTRKYGGNTPCVEVRCGEERIVFDLGTGARVLGQSYPPPLRAHIFLSHYHYDHLQGMPFFTPLFLPQNEFAIYGPTRNGKTVGEILSEQMRQPFFPVSAEMVFRARIDYRPFIEGMQVRVGEAVVTALELHHPGGNLGYRVDYRGHSVVYATDIEHGSNTVDERLAAFARETDLLIYDAMYTEEEYHGRVGPPKTGWGHSTWQASVQAADLARARTLVIFHHEPIRDDAGMDRLIREVRKHRPEAIAAREGQVVNVV